MTHGLALAQTDRRVFPDAADDASGRTGEVDRAALAPAQTLVAVLASLTFVTGIVDAVTYLGLGHVFAANMTGNVVLLGFALVGADQISVSASLVSLGAFVVGATVGGRLARRLQPRQHRWIVTSLCLELGLLVAAMLSAALRPSVADATIAGVLALAMGIRNATVRRLGIADLTTTVLTMLLTVLAADTQTPGGGRDALGRRLTAVAAMLGGAATGALLLAAGGIGWAIGAAVGTVALVTAGYVIVVRAAALRGRRRSLAGWRSTSSAASTRLQDVP